MRFLEYITLPSDADYSVGSSEGSPVAWLSYARCHRERLFPEIMDARYFRLCNEEGDFSGEDVLLLEYTSLKGYLACKNRAAEGDPKSINQVSGCTRDFHEISGLQKVGVEYLEPQRECLWFDSGGRIGTKVQLVFVRSKALVECSKLSVIRRLFLRRLKGNFDVGDNGRAQSNWISKARVVGPKHQGLLVLQALTANAMK